ncbi:MULTISPECIES: hypothetical protein [Streptomyces]|uniref:Uncharacterized protein n=2 Tax=Streptomyces TaxID=1883 RepID=A0A2U9PCL6_STRAS|nr:MULTISPECIES: hypothetical protein [Streptomyces]AWT46668.1 hypothetical protein DMT42_33185 [Streptomyces actuosus]MBM4823394.1 hypothetical protein [Streptomyces actuosus]GHF42423.1 hypothetical protein GCM10018783_09030 [Streptomyces griseosporeus]
MTSVDALLARARLHPGPDVPPDTVAYEDCAYFDLTADPATAPAGEPAGDDTAAEQLDRLCEVVVTAVAPGTLEFLTDQLPEPPAAWLLGCALHLAGVADGARFWWQYAAGAGHSPAAYCLSLHHHARGEEHAAAFWYDQTGLDEAAEADTFPVAGVCPSLSGFRFDASLPTVLRILSHLAAPGRRRLPHRADAVTNYVARAVAHGYRRHPGVEIPVPEPRFADRISFLLGTDPPWARRMARVFHRPALPSRAQSAGSAREGAGKGRTAAEAADAAAASTVASWGRPA